MRQTTIDLEDEIAELRGDKLPAIEDAQEELIAQFEDEYGDYSEVPDEEEDAYDTLEEKRVDLKGTVQALERVVDEWDGSQFTITELSMGAVADVQDKVSEASFSFDHEEGEFEEGVPKQGYGMIETLRQAIVDQPDGAPTYTDEMGNRLPDPADYPHEVGMHLFEKVNAFNTVGETDLGNSSLRERMQR